VFAVLAVLAIVLAGVAVASREGVDANEPERDPLSLADEGELRQAVVAISEVIRAATPEPEERALVALEALHPQSPGAADLRDACVTTYRGAHDAQRLSGEFRALLPADGGVPRGEDRVRLEELIARTRRLVTEANETRDRCVTLYETAARRLHIEAARRPSTKH
jgi:hypothetical protein